MEASRRRAILLLVAVVCLVLLALAVLWQRPGQWATSADLVGTWRQSGKPLGGSPTEVFAVFRADGSGMTWSQIPKGEGMGVDIPFTYRVEKGRVSIDYSHGESAVVDIDSFSFMRIDSRVTGSAQLIHSGTWKRGW